MPAPLLPQASTPLSLELVTAQAGVILLKARTHAEVMVCPLCRRSTGRVHSRYRRRLLDLPWQGQCVRIEIAARKFFCDNPDCKRRIFTEPLPGVTRRYARKTSRLDDALQELVLLVGGEAAARIAKTFGLFLSPDSLLKLAHQAPTFNPSTPRVLGVDDFAFRKGHTYGTILIDHERRCPIDLLPNRESDTLAKWLKAHPGVEIVTRDRAPAYAEGIRDGAPEAIQVADRWHLFKNLGDTLERMAHRLHSVVRAAAKSCEPELAQTGQDPAPNPQPPPNHATRLAAASRERRESFFEQVKQMQDEGLTLREIARRTGRSRNTIRKQARCESFPEGGGRAPRPIKVTPFDGYLRKRWQEGEHNATRLHQEIVVLGFAGKVDLVQRHVQPWRTKSRRRVVTPPRPRAPSPRQVSYLLCRADSQLKEPERAFLSALLSSCPELNLARELALEWGRILRERDVSALERWRALAKSSGLTELVGFAKGLEQDLSAVEASLSWEWSNGPVEGQVNRLKLLKRSMYGRGSFALLRARVLHRTR